MVYNDITIQEQEQNVSVMPYNNNDSLMLRMQNRPCRGRLISPQLCLELMNDPVLELIIKKRKND